MTPPSISSCSPPLSAPPLHARLRSSLGLLPRCLALTPILNSLLPRLLGPSDAPDAGYPTLGRQLAPVPRRAETVPKLPPVLRQANQDRIGRRQGRKEGGAGGGEVLDGWDGRYVDQVSVRARTEWRCGPSADLKLLRECRALSGGYQGLIHVCYGIEFEMDGVVAQGN